MSLKVQTDHWSFTEPRNEVAVTVREILEDRHPILLVSRDTEDGTWEFLTGKTFLVENAMLVALHRIVEHDATVCELANLPVGWSARRDSLDCAWTRFRDDDHDAS